MPMILDAEQTLLQDTARAFCSAHAPIGQLRRLRDEDSADGFDRDTWARMAELGWAGIPFPEQYGGAAFGYKGLGVVSWETGRTLAASPLFATVWVGGTLLHLGGTARQKRELLPQVAAGGALLALALEEGPRHSPHGAALRAARGADGYLLTGAKTFVLDGHVADTLIVAARTAGAAGERAGISLFLVDRRAPGVAVTRTRMVDSRNAANIAFADAAAPPDALLGQEGAGADILDPALDIARIGLAAEMLGSAEECFERTVRYLKERRQFGVPIGSFQALRHRAAQMFCALELAKSCVLEALTALDAPEGERDALRIAQLASLAKAQAGAAFRLISRESIQMHGGIGMTDAFDIGFFIKRAAAAEQTFGDTRFHRNRYGELAGY